MTTRRIRSKVKDIPLSEALRIPGSGKTGTSIQLYYRYMMRRLRNFRSGSIGCDLSIQPMSLKYSKMDSMIHGIVFNTMHHLEATYGIPRAYFTRGLQNYLKTSPSLPLSLFIISSIGRIWQNRQRLCGNGNTMPEMVGLHWFHCLPYCRKYLIGRSRIIL